ncbi:MAG: DUF2723 domain-containing protein, partial [Candidatus Eremiobacteraeota bacterium]|nr:DUF2723 domain-containing protein [Candidatus Eremiobacteraeota bacterium]
MSLRLRWPYALALAFAVPFAVLLVGVRTSVGVWDTADLQTVAWILGIPYPTGYPGYVLLGFLWTHLIPLGNAASRLNALSAFAVAAAAADVCGLVLAFDVAAPVALGAAWMFAFAEPIWQRGTYADVHPLGFAVALAAVALAVRWARTSDVRSLAAALVVAGAALAVDNTTILILTGALLTSLARPWPLRDVLRAALLGVAIVVLAYAYLPLRSAQVTAARTDPTLALGIEPGRPFWDDHHPSAFDGFVELVTGS